MTGPGQRPPARPEQELAAHPGPRRRRFDATVGVVVSVGLHACLLAAIVYGVEVRAVPGRGIRMSCEFGDGLTGGGAGPGARGPASPAAAGPAAGVPAGRPVSTRAASPNPARPEPRASVRSAPPRPPAVSPARVASVPPPPVHVPRPAASRPLPQATPIAQPEHRKTPSHRRRRRPAVQPEEPVSEASLPAQRASETVGPVPPSVTADAVRPATGASGGSAPDGPASSAGAASGAGAPGAGGSGPAGSGPGRGEGRGGTGSGGTGEAVSGYLRQVRQELERAQTYPDEARENGVTGKVKLSFAISTSGTIGQARIEGSSPPELERAALELVSNRRVAAPPPGWNAASRIHVVLRYALR